MLYLILGIILIVIGILAGIAAFKPRPGVSLPANVNSAGFKALDLAIVVFALISGFWVVLVGWRWGRCGEVTPLLVMVTILASLSTVRGVLSR